MLKTRLKELRAREGLKQEELARLVGVRRETIGNLEAGRYNPSLRLAIYRQGLQLYGGGYLHLSRLGPV